MVLRADECTVDQNGKLTRDFVGIGHVQSLGDDFQAPAQFAFMRLGGLARGVIGFSNSADVDLRPR